MRSLIPIFSLLLCATAWAVPLSPALDQPGDFIITDHDGRIARVGRIEMDFAVFFRAYAGGRRESGKADFSLGRYRAGKVEDVSRGTLTYLLSGEQITCDLHPGVPDAGLDFVINFDPAQESR